MDVHHELLPTEVLEMQVPKDIGFPDQKRTGNDGPNCSEQIIYCLICFVDWSAQIVCLIVSPLWKGFASKLAKENLVCAIFA